MTIVIIWQFFLVSELNSCERRIFLVYFYCHMSTLRIKWETYITRDRHTLLVHCVENSLNFKMSYDIWKLTKCSSTYNHLFTVLSFLPKLITIPMGGKGLKQTERDLWQSVYWVQGHQKSLTNEICCFKSLVNDKHVRESIMKLEAFSFFCLFVCLPVCLF